MTYFTPTQKKKYSSLDPQQCPLDFSLEDLLEKREKISACVRVNHVTPSKLDMSQGPCQRGVDFILSHLEEPIFPRDIMTKKLGYKIEVFSKTSMFSYFQDSDYQDCRISAYPRLTQYNGINLVPPSLIMIDLDLGNFDSRKSLDATLKATLKRISRILMTRPTVLWTGNGYHMYLPIKAFLLEEEEVFANFQTGKYNEPSLSTKFMRFAEDFLTNRKHDPRHRPSVNSCLLRAPGSFNSKNGQQVSVIQLWDGKKAAIQYMLRSFRRYLIQEKLDEINNRNKKLYELSINTSSHAIRWIERLLKTPIHDYRRYCIWRILAPYVVNVLNLSDKESALKLTQWLDKCDSIRRLSFDPRYILKYNIRHSRRIGFYPIGRNTLKLENIYLYQLLSTDNNGLK